MQYFTISELLRSDTAIKKKIWNGANREQEDNLIALVSAVLDPLRAKYGKPIRVTSGFRCLAVNKSVGGAVTSQHTEGEAADIVGGSTAENYRLGRLIVALGNYDQVIFEDVGKSDLLPQWIHVSWRRKGDNRHIILKKVKGTKSYIHITQKDLGL